MRRVAVLVVGLVAAAGCGRLGVWQLHRLAERRARNAEVERARRLPPLALDASSDDLPLLHRRVTARGTWDFAREIVVTTRSARGMPAVYVVTPLRLASGHAVLVERGWVPSPDGRTVRLDDVREADSATVEGVVMPVSATGSLDGAGWPLRVRGLDPRQLAARFPYPLTDAVVRRTSAPTVAGLGAIPLPELSNGPHRSYAVQWFAFGVIAVVGSGILFVRLGGAGAGGGPSRPLG